MAASAAIAKPTWENRFERPSGDSLLDPMNKQVQALLEYARRRIKGLPGIRETIEWHGVPWRWTFTFRAASVDSHHPIAFIVPQPTKPILAMPLPAEIVVRLPARKLSKPTRDCIVNAPEVDGILWTCWDVTSKTQVDELLIIATARLEPTPANA